MTRIRYRTKPVWHETGLRDSQSGRAYLVAQTPINLLIRLKGTRQVLSLPWNIAFLRAAMLLVESKRATDQTRAGRRSRTRSVTRSALIGGGAVR